MFKLYPLCSSVLILKPRVGDIVVMSSPLNFFRIVVFPALSRPLNNKKKDKMWQKTHNSFQSPKSNETYSIRMRTSFSFSFNFLRIDKSPIFSVYSITPFLNINTTKVSKYRQIWSSILLVFALFFHDFSCFMSFMCSAYGGIKSIHLIKAKSYQKIIFQIHCRAICK